MARYFPIAGGDCRCHLAIGRELHALPVLIGERANALHPGLKEARTPRLEFGERRHLQGLAGVTVSAAPVDRTGPEIEDHAPLAPKNVPPVAGRQLWPRRAG